MAVEDIIKELINIFRNDTDLNYIRAVLVGDRPENYSPMFPNITIEPSSNMTERILEDRRKLNCLKLMIAGAILIDDMEKQILGTNTTKGIMDLEKDIKNTLMKYYPDLNGKCLYFNLSTVSYSLLESGKGRVVFIEGNFYYIED